MYKLPQWQTLNDFFHFGTVKPRFCLSNWNPSSESLFCGISKAGPETAFSHSEATLHFGPYFFEGGWQLHPLIQVPGLELQGETCEFDSMPVGRIHLEKSLGLLFKKRVSQAEHWGAGDSNAEFPELKEFSKHMKDLTLESLALALRERANQQTDTIEIFQAKLPPSAIPTFGCFILLLCQFIFWDTWWSCEKSPGMRSPQIFRPDTLGYIKVQ
jgi:hypothetical protein